MSIRARWRVYAHKTCCEASVLSERNLLRAFFVVMGLGTLSVCGLAILVMAMTGDDGSLRAAVSTLACQGKTQPLPTAVVRSLCESGLVQGGRACAASLPAMNYTDFEKLVYATIVPGSDTYQIVERKFGKFRTDQSNADSGEHFCTYLLSREGPPMLVVVFFNGDGRVRSVFVEGIDC